MSKTLLTIAPVRGRRELAEKMLASFTETAAFSDIAFVTDPDDQDTYEGMDWGPAATAVLDPRGSFTEKVNSVALACAAGYDACYVVSDDNVFRTKGWDAIMMGALADMGGTGWVYPENRKRRDIPEHWLMSSDLIAELGWFAPPYVKHYYPDNIIAELGKRTGLLRFCPEAVITNEHYSVAGTERDEVYRYAEETWGQADLAAFMAWRADVMPLEVARLRRKFSRDIEWVLSRIA